MTKKIHKAYLFSVVTSLIVSLSITAVMTAFFYFSTEQFAIFPLFILALVSFFFCFGIVQFRVEKYIYKQVKRIYNNVSLLEASTLRPKNITTDMATLTKEVERY